MADAIVVRLRFLGQSPREERTGQTKEYTYIYETYFPQPHNRLGPYHGWWILDAKVPYLLFPNQENAKAWQEAM